SNSAPAITPPLSLIPSCPNRAPTVCGLSPLISFGSIPSLSIIANAERTSGRNTSPIVSNANGRTPLIETPNSGSDAASANTTPRRPSSAAFSYMPCRPLSGSSVGPVVVPPASGNTVSGAPSMNTRVSPFRSNFIALQRRSELNGTPPNGRAPLLFPPSASASAPAVLLSLALALTNAPSQPSYTSIPSTQCTASKLNRLAVIVPVLSRQITSR